mgnify:CR=1 FL=1
MKIPFFSAKRTSKDDLGGTLESDALNQPLQVPFDALAIVRDSLGQTHERAGTPSFEGYIEVTLKQSNALFALDDQLIRSLYSAKASIPDRFTVFDKEGAQLAHDAVLSTAGRQCLSFSIGPQEYMASFDLATEISEQVQNRHKTAKPKTGMGM